MIKKLKELFVSDWIIYAVSIAFWLFINISIRYLPGDDYIWASEEGLRKFLAGEENARWVGNTLIILMTRSNIFRIAFMTVADLLLCYVMSVFMSLKTEKKNNSLLFVISQFVLLFIHPGIWNQTIGWCSGFANYVTSAFCCIVFLIFFEKYRDDKFSCSKAGCIGIFIFAVASMLMMFIMLFVRKKTSKEVLSLFAGSVVGCLIMFPVSFYGELIKTGKIEHLEAAHRKFVWDDDSFLIDKIKAVAERILLLCLEAFTKYETFLIVFFIVILAMYSTVLKVRKPDDVKSFYMDLGVLAYNIIIPMSIFFLIEIFGSRNYFYGYIIVMMYCIIWCVKLYDILSENKDRNTQMIRMGRYVIYVCMVLFYVRFIWLYTELDSVYDRYDDLIDKNQASEVMYLPFIHVSKANKMYIYNYNMIFKLSGLQNSLLYKYKDNYNNSKKYLSYDEDGRFAMEYDKDDNKYILYSDGSYDIDDIYYILDDEYDTHINSEDRENTEYRECDKSWLQSLADMM